MPNKKLTISPGQGLLLLIDFYQKQNQTDIVAATIIELKKLYLSGARSDQDYQRIINYLKHEQLSNYNISDNKQVINNDSTRRYFETHLCYETLKNNIDTISAHELKQYVNQLQSMLTPLQIYRIENVLEGKVLKFDRQLNTEMADYINKVQTEVMYKDLSIDNRKKIILLIKAAFLGVMVTGYNNHTLPLDIYGEGLYSDEQKGKKTIYDQHSTRNMNAGILKGTMPLPLDDIARLETEYPYLKPSDQATFIEDALWVKMNFDQLVHPFSNSISGTMLCQLRCMAALKAKHDIGAVLIDTEEKMSAYCTLFISAMLFGTGGHSLNEYTAPLSLPEVKSFFHIADLTLENMYYSYDQLQLDSLNQALADTLVYNNQILLNQQVHAEIHDLALIKKGENLTKEDFLQYKSQHNELVEHPEETVNIHKAH